MADSGHHVWYEGLTGPFTREALRERLNKPPLSAFQFVKFYPDAGRARGLAFDPDSRLVELWYDLEPGGWERWVLDGEPIPVTS